MSEKSFWEYLREGMRGKWNACRHEDAATPGVPDVSYGMNGIQGWIELKSLHTWPKRKDTSIPLKHLTGFQKAWLKQRGRTGAACWIFLRVEKDYMLFSWRIVDELGCANREKLYSIATVVYHERIDWEDLVKQLANP